MCGSFPAPSESFEAVGLESPRKLKTTAYCDVVPAATWAFPAP